MPRRGESKETPPPSSDRRRPDRIEHILQRIGETDEPVSYRQMREVGREIDRTFVNSAVDMVKSVSRVTRDFWRRLGQLVWPVAKRRVRENVRAAKVAAITTIPGALTAYRVYRGAKTAEQIAQQRAREAREREARTQRLIEDLRQRAEEAERVAREALAASAARANTSIHQGALASSAPSASPEAVPFIQVVAPPTQPAPEVASREAFVNSGDVVLNAATEIPPHRA